MRRIRNWFLPVVVIIGWSELAAQGDTLQGISADDVMVTATRTERKLSNVAVPAFIIQNKQLQQVQLRRLNEILQEQTGIAVTAGSGTGGFGGGIFGNGAQLQGMSPDYTMILINGEPIVGRQGGTLNLSRLTLSNIRKIEVIKGPASSLYGSEAMGGVINIITDMPDGNHAEVQAKAGGYNLRDITATGGINSRKTRLQLSYNLFNMGAIDHDKNTYGNQQDPFRSHTGQLQWTQYLGPKTKLLMYGRFFQERVTNDYEVVDESGSPIRLNGNTNVQDANLNTSLVHQFNKKVQTSLRLYGTRYLSEQDLKVDKTGADYYYDRFQQQFFRVENQTDIQLPANNNLILGGGYVYEHLNTTRYAGVRTNSVAYAFFQNEWKPKENLNIIGGLRYDANQQYASRISPKLAARWSPSEKWKLTASYGAGFKAPDFRQLYLSFINNASGGYALFGANEISIERLETLKQQGLISQILDRAYDLQELKPETSHGLNAGATYQVNTKLSTEINLFYNAINNQILFDVVALRNNGSQVFSYFNIARSFTSGTELNAKWDISKAWQLSGGYQLLFTGDRDVINAIQDGQVFGRREGSNQVYQLSLSDYKGLPGRSRHMANLKLFYQHPNQGWFASTRAIYRSGWGTFDQDGNGIINRKDEMANGFVQLNMTAGKRIGQHWMITGGVENILNHRDALNMPNLPGINAWLGVQFNITTNKKP